MLSRTTKARIKILAGGNAFCGALRDAQPLTQPARFIRICASVAEVFEGDAMPGLHAAKTEHLSEPSITPGRCYRAKLDPFRGSWTATGQTDFTWPNPNLDHGTG